MILGFTGDLFLGSVFKPDAFAAIAPELPAGTELVINFEGTLFDNAAELVPARKKILLDSPASLLPMLNPLPVSAAVIGNNHIGDYGNEIASYTLKCLAPRFPVLGAGYEKDDFHVLTRNFGDVRLAFANYCAADTSPLFCTEARIGPRPLCLDRARDDYQRLSKQADHCIAIVHWGLEYFHHPRPAHVRLGRKLIDAGFKLVIGHHSHSAQGFERYRDGLIFYSLGNFYFPEHTAKVGDQAFRLKAMPRTSWGVLPCFDVTKDRLDLRTIQLTHQPRNGVPAFTDSARLRNRFQRISKSLSSRRYTKHYRRICRAESWSIRYEEFCNNEQKLQSLIRKLKRVVVRS
jgi:hypothetical protein